MSEEQIVVSEDKPAESAETPHSHFIIRLNWVDYITLSSVVSTWMSIMLTLSGALNGAMSLLFLAMLADAFDGILARKYGTERNFGRYLDGFMDVLIYLVSPSLILYESGFSGFYVIFIIAMIGFGCIRLSVFNDIGNIQESDGLSYLGMPVFWSIPIVGLHQLMSQFTQSELPNVMLALGLSAFCYFMIVKRPFFKFTSLVQILSITLGGFAVFLALEFRSSAPMPLGELIAVALYLIWPVIVGGVLHMIVVTKDMFKPLKIPVSVSLFGANKTLRGFVVMPIFTTIGFLTLYPFQSWISATAAIPTPDNINLIVIGMVSGFLYVLAELPNSFLKRRMGAAPGETPERFKLLFVGLDQLDSALFISLGYALVFDFHWTVCLLAFVLSPVVALLVKRLLYAAKLKKTKT